MKTIEQGIISRLKKEPLKPGALAISLGVSRQALHRHLHSLLERKLIEKHGSGSHVSYSLIAHIAEGRILSDYSFCKEQLLPDFLNKFSDSLGGYVKKFTAREAEKRAIKQPDFGFIIESAAVSSSNIEGNSLNLNSFLNSRMSPKKHRPKEAGGIEDLVLAYLFSRKHKLTEENVLKAHGILSQNFVSKTRQGVYRQERVGVYSHRSLEYMAVEPELVRGEMKELFQIVGRMMKEEQNPAKSFFWAIWLHLMLALIHPFSDGNGRISRLCEKWFLAEKIGKGMYGFLSEELYFSKRSEYYAALKLGLNYWETDLKKAKAFFFLLPESLVK